MAAADARAALLGSRVARGLAHAVQVLLAVAVFLRTMADFVPSGAAVAASPVLRVGASFLVPSCVSFVIANCLVIALAVCFRSDAAKSSPSPADPSSSPNSYGDAQDPILDEFTRRSPTQPPAHEAEASPLKEAPPEVLGNKEDVRVKEVPEAKALPLKEAQPPRRSMSEKTGGGGAAAAGRETKAAARELRRAESENCRRRQLQRSTSVAADAEAPVESVDMDDAEAFRREVEAFIKKQRTWFYREESLVARAAAAAAGKKDGPAIAGAVVAVK